MCRVTVVLNVMFVMLFLTACSESPEKVTENVRSVKTYTVSQSAGGSIRKFSGQIVAENSASLSFPAAGTVKQVLISSGDTVTSNQVLATMDEVPFRLDVEAAEAELRKAQSNAKEKKAEFSRSKSLFDKGWVSKAAMDQVQFAMDTTVEEVNFKTSRLNLAKRSLNDTKLRAPYNGVVGQRLVEPNEEVAGGEPILTLDAEGALEISISVPEKMISKLNMGMPAIATFSVMPGEKLEGRVTEISRVAGVGNIFPVTVSLINPPKDLRAGMSGDVELTTQNNDQEFGFLIPLSAVAAGKDMKGGYVFVFDEETSTLKKVEIKTDSARDNFIGVKGVHSGDLVVTAGVSFLSEGQKVKLMNKAAQ